MHARGEGNNKIITEVEHFSRFELSFVKIFTRNINRKQRFLKSHSGYEVDGLAIIALSDAFVDDTIYVNCFSEKISLKL